VFYHKNILPIGKTVWTNGGGEYDYWNYHQVAWWDDLIDQEVYDAYIRLDNPERIPLGESINGIYKDDLFNDGANEYWYFYYIHDWLPQEPFPITTVVTW